MGRALLKAGLYLAVVAIVIGAFAVHSPEAFARVPSEKRPDLVGDWYVDRFGSFRKYTFNQDGTGEILIPGREGRKFQWGSVGNRLRMKYQTPNGWSAPVYEVKVDSEAKLQAVEGGYSMVMKREAPPSASLP